MTRTAPPRTAPPRSAPPGSASRRSTLRRIATRRGGSIVRSKVAPLVALALVALAACGGDESDPAGDAEPTGPAVSPVVARDGETVLAVVGDAGELNDDTLAVAALVAASGAAAVFTVGDNEYTTEGRTLASYEESVGEVYGHWVDDGTFFPIPGDHDYGDRCDDEDEPADLDAYLEYFELPIGPEDETYYDVRIGDVHVFAIDSLADCHRDGGAKLARQQAWLADAASASDAGLKIALIHNPPYSSGESHGSVESLRWDFADWGIRLVVSGDDHIYERSTHDGVAYVVNGLGGVEVHELGDPIDGSEVGFAEEFGALFVTVAGDTADVAFATVGGEIVDSFSIPLAGGRDAIDDAIDATVDEAAAVPSTLTVASTWQWQLQGELDTSIDVDVYDVDLFGTDTATVDALHADGRTVVCYFSAGSYEDWRDDAGDVADTALGDTLDGWEDERWLDVRDASVRAVAEARLDLAAERGCDGVEPDNVDGYANDTGFDLTADDQLDFNRFLAAGAHARGLLVGLKNDLDQIPQLVDDFDFAVNEQCHEYDECDVYGAFTDRDKPVFNAEYAAAIVDDPGPVCATSRELDLRTLVLPLDLDGSFRFSCDE